MTMIEVKNLEKSFGARKAVDGVSFEVKAGEVFGLLGPNGAGKSTTLSLITGLLKPDSGRVSIGAIDMGKEPIKAKGLIGVVPQEPAIYPQLSARANLRFWGEMQGLVSQELSVAVERALKVAGLEDRANDRAGKYSGGMKRRLNIAAGLVHNPQILIMDEPTVGVDPQSRRHILDAVKELKENGMTVIYTSHYVEEVEYLCDRVAIMDHGKILAEGTTAELLSQAGEFQELSISLSNPEKLIAGRVVSLPGVEDALVVGNALRVLTVNAEQVLPLVFETLVQQGLQVTEIKISKPNLESLFLKLTGRALRD